MRRFFMIIFMALGVFMSCPASSAIELPNYAQGGQNLKTSAQKTGKAVTDIISLIVAILSIIGILIGSGYIGIGKPEKGKPIAVGGVVALIIAGSVYGIAALVT